ncbi:MAG: sugar transferase [Ignavibacteria bacterium]|nr:sugar transferase [Ignavibacteria bacterium]
MSSKKELFLLLVSDLIFANLSWSIYYYIRIESGWINFTNVPSFLGPMIFVFIYWVFFFYIFGLYKHWFIRSRFEEFLTLVRTISFGCLLLFFFIFLDDYYKDAKIVSRFLILIYWGLMVFWVSLGRITIRSFQMSLLRKGYGLRNTIIVGTGEKANEVKEMIYANPKLGYKFIGFVGINGDEIEHEQLGVLDNIQDIVSKYEVDDVLIASDQKYDELIIKTMNLCSALKVSIKIVPEVYEIVSGMVKSVQVHGIPLVEVKTELMPFTSRQFKTIIDYFLSLSLLILFSPVMILIILYIIIIQKDRIFIKQKKIGRNMKIFRNIKFNVKQKGIGNLIQRFKLDSLPLLFNVLKNDMSLVGPEPEDIENVEAAITEVPYYTRRMKINPGITGWSQIKSFGDTDISSKKKLQYDFYYLENMSLLLDFKILLNTLISILTNKKI